MEEIVRTFLLAALIAGSTALVVLPVQAASVDADITIRNSRDHDGDSWRRRTVRHDRGLHRGWRDGRPHGVTVRRVHRPAFGSCKTVVKKIWRHGERVTIRRRTCD
jgi:hypothetical protein